MCAKQWDEIDFNTVPSLAAARYRSAFLRNAEERYSKYIEALKSGTPAKVNAGAIFPHDVVKSCFTSTPDEREIDFIQAQWNALPNYVGDNKILPMIDVSGSMSYRVGTTTAMNIAISLGMYCAEKNTGVFKDLYLTFSENPVLGKIEGDDIYERYRHILGSDWGFNTNIYKALEKIYEVATVNNVSQEDLPDYLLIISDMQFDQCQSGSGNFISKAKKLFEAAGYELPAIIFWNLVNTNNVPSLAEERGVSMISGFSPAIMKEVLSINLGELTPQKVMLSTVMKERYAF
jgi:hypothetical protein